MISPSLHLLPSAEVQDLLELLGVQLALLPHHLEVVLHFTLELAPRLLAQRLVVLALAVVFEHVLGTDGALFAFVKEDEQLSDLLSSHFGELDRRVEEHPLEVVEGDRFGLVIFEFVFEIDEEVPAVLLEVDVLEESVETGLVDLSGLRVVLEYLKQLLEFGLHQMPLQTQINPLVSNQYMSWYYRNQQPQYSFANNYHNYYPSEHSTYPTNYSQYRGWRRTSPKLDYPETRFGVDQANHRAEYNYNAANSDFGVRRGHINQDWEYRTGKSWPIQPGLYQQETWGQWGIRDSRVRLAYEGAVDRIFSRY